MDLSTIDPRLLDPRYKRAFGNFETREVGEKDGKLWIEGTISAVSQDRHKTRWRQSAIRDALPTFTTRGLHYEHDIGAQIGRVETIDVTDSATAIRAWVGRDFKFPYQPNPFAAPIQLDVNDVRKQMEQGLMRGLSISALVDEEKPKDGSDEKWLRATDIIEFSVTAIPSNRETLSTVLRSIAAGGVCPLCQGHQPVAHIVTHDESIEAALATMRGTHDEGHDVLALISKEFRQWTP